MLTSLSWWHQIEQDLKQTITHDAITSRRAVHVSALVEEMGGDRPY
jgi:hypothetical protein